MKKYKVMYAGLSEYEVTIESNNPKEAAKIFFANQKAKNQIYVSGSFLCNKIYYWKEFSKDFPEMNGENLPYIDTPESYRKIYNLTESVDENQKSIQSEKGIQNMQIGALWCIGGIIVTSVSYHDASEGGTYIITWGAVVFGAIQFIKGFFQFILPSQNAEEFDQTIDSSKDK